MEVTVEIQTDRQLKRVRAYVNSDRMETKWWREGAAVLMLGAVLVAGCASAPARADAPVEYAQAVATSAPAAATTAASASEHPSEHPSDPGAAFVDGYRAYLRREYARAIDELKFAADNFHPLGDYALYYLALAQKAQNDLAGSADTLQRLIKTYPESVTIDQAEFQLGENLVKLGRNQEASAVAGRLVARQPEPAIEQGARVVEAKALIALGNPKLAYTRLMELRDRYPRSDAD